MPCKGQHLVETCSSNYCFKHSPLGVRKKKKRKDRPEHGAPHQKGREKKREEKPKVAMICCRPCCFSFFPLGNKDLAPRVGFGLAKQSGFVPGLGILEAEVEVPGSSWERNGGSGVRGGGGGWDVVGMGWGWGGDGVVGGWGWGSWGWWVWWGGGGGVGVGMGGVAWDRCPSWTIQNGMPCARPGKWGTSAIHISTQVWPFAEGATSKHVGYAVSHGESSQAKQVLQAASRENCQISDDGNWRSR